MVYRTLDGDRDPLMSPLQYQQVNQPLFQCPSLHNEDLANINYDDYANGHDDVTISRSSLVSVHGKVISAHTNMHRCQV